MKLIFDCEVIKIFVIINGVTINVDDLLNDFRDSTHMPYRFNLPIKVNSIGDKMKNKLYLVTVKDLEIPTMEVKMRYCVETDNVNKIKDYFKHENRKIVSIEEDLRAKQKGQYLYID